MGKMVRLTIDEVQIEASPEKTVLETAQDAGIYIPSLCADPDLLPYGACRLCVVEIEGMRGLPTACTTRVAEGMVVHTDTPQVNHVRRIAAELLIAYHKGDCLVCPKNMRCDLQRVASYLGIDQQRLRKSTRELPIDDSNPFFNRDLNKCILCGKCVRVCKEVQGVRAIDMVSRGFETEVCPFGGMPIKESRCGSCGECMVRCPVGALYPKITMEEPSKEVKTVCTYCGVGCSLYLGVRRGNVVSVRGNRESPTNKGILCVKGRFGIIDFLNHSERLKTPLIRKDGELIEASWDEALSLVAEKLSQYKGDSFAGISSAKATNEDNYIMQKFVRAMMKTNNIDHCARL